MLDKRKKIAIVAGGDSGEQVISVKSAMMIRKNMDPDLFDAYVVLISRSKWVCLLSGDEEAVIDRNDFSVTTAGGKITFDCAYITIHGTPGEDGKLQGYLDLLGIPYTTAGLLPSALTFNKYFCSLVASQFGMHVPKSIKVSRGQRLAEEELTQLFSFPVFVKPNKGGSSLGNSLVESYDALGQAVELAFEHDDEVLVEEFLPGQEFTCGVVRFGGRVVALPVTMVTSKSGVIFFDFKAKYTKDAAEEITPAPVSEELTRQIRETTAMLYEKFDLKGIVRMDYILHEGKLYFLEINVTPGMSETSIVPQQAAIEGISVRELFTAVIEEAMRGVTRELK